MPLLKNQLCMVLPLTLLCCAATLQILRSAMHIEVLGLIPLQWMLGWKQQCV